MRQPARYSFQPSPIISIGFEIMPTNYEPQPNCVVGKTAFTSTLSLLTEYSSLSTLNSVVAGLEMDVIGEDRLKGVAKKHQNARTALARWLKLTKAATWNNFQDVRSTFPATDYIPQNQYCFDIGGNSYRLITAISFQLSTVVILDFMTHAEYDKKKLNTR